MERHAMKESAGFVIREKTNIIFFLNVLIIEPFEGHI